MNGNHTKADIGDYSVDYYGIGKPTFSVRGTITTIAFHQDAESLPDEGAGFSIFVPYNSGVVAPGAHPPTEVRALFMDDDSPRTCASKLAAELSKSGIFGYIVKHSGNKVSIQRELLQ
jgi:hypothetical protein